MFTFALAQTGAAENAWAKARAAHDLLSAVDALEDARASLIRLAVDTQWHSDGVRAMRDAIADFESRTGVESSAVRDRASEVARIDAS